MSAVSISELNSYDGDCREFTVSFYDDYIYTVVTDDPNKVAKWIAEIESIHRRRLHHLVVGLDVEWCPNNRYRNNPVATLQLCVGRRCLIFQLLYCPNDSIPQELYDFLSCEDYTFVGVGIHGDIQKLENDHGLEVSGNVVDLRTLAASRCASGELRNTGLAGLARAVLGKEVNKPRSITMSRWDFRWLSDEQIQYACVDAFVSFELGRVLNAPTFNY